MRTATCTPVLVLVFVLGTHSHAAAEWTVSAFLGHAWNQPGKLHMVSLLDNTDLTIHAVDYEDQSFRLPIYYGARLTRFITRVPWLGVEGEFIHLKAISKPQQVVDAGGRFGGRSVTGSARLGEFLPHFELSHGLNFVLANAVVRVPLMSRTASRSSRRLALMVRGGLGPTIPHVEGQSLGRGENGYQLSGLGWQAAMGVDVRIMDWLSAVSEVKWTGSHQRVTLGETDIEGPFRARHVIVGLALAPRRTAPTPPRGNTATENGFLHN